MVVLGLYYAARKDMENAKSWLQESVSAGNPFGMMCMGDLFPGQDQAGQRAWYAKAAGAKIPRAERTYGGMLLDGSGGEKQADEGKVQLLAAANAGNESAMIEVGMGYLKLGGRYDDVLPENSRLGEHYLTTAASRGSKRAKRAFRPHFLSILSHIREQSCSRSFAESSTRSLHP